MLRVIIIEDELPAEAHLLTMLRKAEPDSTVLSVIRSVKEGIDYFTRLNGADIIFSDVQLSDGLSFDIFREAPTSAPVVFVTGYDQFILNALEYNSIDYLLKPVNEDDLSKALSKYRRLEKHFAAHQHTAISRLMQQLGGKKRTRIIVQRGIEHYSLRLEDVVLFYTENKVVYVLDKAGRKYMGHQNLSELEDELDPEQFFRANRQYIINIEYVRGFKPFEKVKLQIELTLQDVSHQIIISQETAPAFRKWMHGNS